MLGNSKVVKMLLKQYEPEIKENIVKMSISVKSYLENCELKQNEVEAIPFLDYEGDNPFVIIGAFNDKQQFVREITRYNLFELAQTHLVGSSKKALKK